MSTLSGLVLVVILVLCFLAASAAHTSIQAFGLVTALL